jgi:hypothetical protein
MNTDRIEKQIVLQAPIARVGAPHRWPKVAHGDTKL